MMRNHWELPPGEISFDNRNDLYEITMTGEIIDKDILDALLSTSSATCPICNNERRDQIDRDIMRGRTSDTIIKKYMVPARVLTGSREVTMHMKSKNIKLNPSSSAPGVVVPVQAFTAEDLKFHAWRHVFPVMAEAMEILSGWGIRIGKIELSDKGKRVSMEKKADEALRTAEYATQCLIAAESRWSVSGNIAISMNSRDREKWRKYGAAMPEEVEMLPSKQKRYMIGADGVSKYKPWGYGRLMRELEKKTENTVNFLDEMMNIRKMSYRIYNEIMDNGDVKLYGTAIGAVRELRGVMETLGKMSLIAKKLGDDSVGVKRLSAPMQDMIRKMGVLGEETQNTDGPTAVADGPNAVADGPSDPMENVSPSNVSPGKEDSGEVYNAQASSEGLSDTQDKPVRKLLETIAEADAEVERLSIDSSISIDGGVDGESDDDMDEATDVYITEGIIRGKDYAEDAEVIDA